MYKHPDYMVGKGLAPIELGLYASADYIEEFGRPATPEELENHQLLVLGGELKNLMVNEWLTGLVPKSAIGLSCNMYTSLYNYTLQGIGIAPLPTYVGDSDSKLVRVMAVPEKFFANIWMLTHPDLRKTRRISAFMQFMYSNT